MKTGRGIQVGEAGGGVVSLVELQTRLVGELEAKSSIMLMNARERLAELLLEA